VMRVGLIALLALISTAVPAYSQAQSSAIEENKEAVKLTVPTGPLKLPEITEQELYVLSLASYFELRDFAADMECRSLFEYILRDTSVVTEEQALVYKFAFHTYNNVLNRYEFDGLPEGYKPGVITSFVIGEKPNGGFVEAVQVSYVDCIRRYKSAFKAYEANGSLAKGEKKAAK